MIDRASPTDRAFLAMDTGQVPEQFGVILLLDQVGELDLSRARRLIAERIPAVPRLRQRLFQAPFGCGGPIWVDDPDFDIRSHVRAVACSEPGDEQALLDTALSVIVAPLRRNAPLWSAVLITGPTEGRKALVVVLHHALADGVGGLAILANLIDAPVDAPSVCFPRPAAGPARLAEEAWVGRLRGLRPQRPGLGPAAHVYGRWGRASAAAGRTLFAEPAHGSPPTADGGPCRPSNAAGSGAWTRRDHQRRDPGRGGRRAAPGAEDKRGVPGHGRGDRAGVRLPPRQWARTRQHGQPDARARPGQRRCGTAAGAGRRPGSRAQGGRDRATPDRRAGLAVPAPGRARRLPLVHEPPAPVPHLGKPRAWPHGTGSPSADPRSPPPSRLGWPRAGTSRSISRCCPTRAPLP